MDGAGLGGTRNAHARGVASMTHGPLRCVECGTVWQSAPAARVAASHGGCLTCGGELVRVTDDEDDEDVEESG